jgi:hypothetical protein
MSKALQIRVPIAKGGSLEQFEYEDKILRIVAASRNIDLLPAGFPLHPHRQLIAEDKSGNRYEVLAYFYSRVEGGSFAVVDHVRPA